MIKTLKTKRRQHQARKQKRLRAGRRARLAHPFRVIRRRFGDAKVRCRDIAKNAAQMLRRFALSNVWRSRRRLMLAVEGQARPLDGGPVWRREKNAEFRAD